MASETIDQWRTQNAITSPSDDCLLPTKDAGATGATKVVELRGAHSTKNSVRIASTLAGTLATAYANGQVVDGVTLVTGDRILIQRQSSKVENGIYIVAASGAPARAPDMPAASRAAGLMVYAQEGSENKDTLIGCTTAAVADIVGTHALNFSIIANITGALGASDNALVRYDGTTGKLVQSSQTLEDDTGNVTVSGTVAAEGVVSVSVAAGAASVRIDENSASEGIGVPNQARLYAKQATSGATELYGFNSAGDITQLTGVEALPSAHAARHLTGAGDEIDGDQIDIDWTPSNYTPSTTPAEASSVDNLTAHLYGIDQEIPIGVPTAVTATTLTTTSAHYNGVTECSNAAGCTVTIANTSPKVGTIMTFWASTTSQAITLVAGSGVTFEPLEGKTLVSNGHGHSVSVFFVTTTNCLLIGSFA